MAPPPTKSPDASPEARANDIAQKSESMARERSQKREMRIRQERVRHLSSDDAPVPDRPRPSTRAGGTKPPTPDDKTIRAEDALPRGEPESRPRPSRDRERERGDRPEGRPEARRDGREPAPASPPFYPERRPSIVDDVAVELEELLRDMRSAWRRFEASDKITTFAALLTLVGVLMPWLGEKGGTWRMGLNAGGAAHAALAVAAIALVVARNRRYDARGERLAGRERQGRARRVSLWHLLLGAGSTLLCAYFLVVYGLQRSSAPGLEIRFGLYVTLAAGMGLSYGGFARFWSRHEPPREDR